MGEGFLRGREIAAWQAINVPRILDDPDHDPDPGPDEELAAMFGRTQAALSGWMQALDRRDVVDLDQVREVPQALRDETYFVSPSIRKTTIRLVRQSAAMSYFFNHSTTSGPRNPRA